MVSLVQLGVTSLLTYNLVKNLQKRIVLRDASDIPEGVLSGLTMAIPVRNESENLKELIPQIVDSRQRPEALIFLNDQSDDDTESVILDWQKKHSWISLVNGQDLPGGWKGKAWAMQQLVRQIETQNVLFIDADVRLKSPFSLGILYREFLTRGKGHFVSVFPRLTGNFGAKLLLDQVAFHLHYFLPFNAEKLPTKDAVAATGQIMMASVQDLLDMNAFGRIRGSTHDGLKLARLYSNSGKSVTVFDGQNLFDCLMYPDFKSSFIGFSRNALEAYGNSPLVIAGMTALVFWIFVLPFFIWPLMLADPAFLTSFFLVIFGQVLLAKEFNLGLTSVLSTPIKGLSTVGVNVWSVAGKAFRAKTQWKGRLLNYG
jgi:glycosyltransferase involved in cell wall biosynthesis